MAKNEVVYGICTNRQILEDAAEALKNDGFPAADVAFLAPESLGKSGMTTEKSTKAPEGAAAGAGSGLLLGGALGWFVGVGALAIPGIGPLIAAGPILAALAGALRRHDHQGRHAHLHPLRHQRTARSRQETSHRRRRRRCLVRHLRNRQERLH
jgi:hypothetical protein